MRMFSEYGASRLRYLGGGEWELLHNSVPVGKIVRLADCFMSDKVDLAKAHLHGNKFATGGKAKLLNELAYRIVYSQD